jgi:hypothetical protein
VAAGEPQRTRCVRQADLGAEHCSAQPTQIANRDDTRIKQLEMLQAVDEAIGGSTTYGITGIMQHLRNLGIDDNTVVIYFSDNGWHWGEHRYRAKNKPYEESIRAPGVRARMRQVFGMIHSARAEGAEAAAALEQALIEQRALRGADDPEAIESQYQLALLLTAALIAQTVLTWLARRSPRCRAPVPRKRTGRYGCR